MTGTIILGIVTGVIGIIIGYLYAQGKSRLIAGQNASLADQIKQRDAESGELNKRLREEIGMRSRFESDAARIPELIRENSILRTLESKLAESEMARKKDQAAIGEKLALLEEAKKNLIDAFGDLSRQALSANSKDFLNLAKSDFSSRQQNLDNLLKPVKDNLTKLDEFNRELEQKRAGAYSSLEAHIKTLQESEQFLREETSQLVKALREPVARGMWGQEQLRRVLEIAGLEENIHFNEQVECIIDGKTRYADFVVHMADGKHIIIDAKTPIEIYSRVTSALTKEEEKESLKSLTQNILGYAKDLKSKEYWRYYGDSPGIVIMFIPRESMLNAAMQFDPLLWNECIKMRILLASPTSLIAILYSIAFGWRQDSFEKNAEQIRKLGEDIYSRLATFSDHLQELGKLLGRSVTKYNETIGSLDHNVLPSARKMKDLGISAGKKVIPDLLPIEAEMRTPQAPELFLSENGGEASSRS